MGELRQTSASLRFFGDDLDPDEISAALGAEPTVGVRKGGVWSTSRGVAKLANSGSWRLHAERRTPGDLEGQVAGLLEPLTSDLNVWKTLTRRFQADIFCGLFLATGNDGASLSPQTLLAIGARGLSIELDIYIDFETYERIEDNQT